LEGGLCICEKKGHEYFTVFKLKKKKKKWRGAIHGTLGGLKQGEIWWGGFGAHNKNKKLPYGSSFLTNNSFTGLGVTCGSEVPLKRVGGF